MDEVTAAQKTWVTSYRHTPVSEEPGLDLSLPASTSPVLPLHHAASPPSFITWEMRWATPRRGYGLPSPLTVSKMETISLLVLPPILSPHPSSFSEIQKPWYPPFLIPRLQDRSPYNSPSVCVSHQREGAHCGKDLTISSRPEHILSQPWGKGRQGGAGEIGSNK